MYSRQSRDINPFDHLVALKEKNMDNDNQNLLLTAGSPPLLFFRFQNLTISIWTWMGLSISVPTRMTRMSTFAFLRKRFLLTSSITWRCSSGSSSLARSSSWRWMVWHQGQRWTSRGDGDSGRNGYRTKIIMEEYYPLLVCEWVSSGVMPLAPWSVCLFGIVMERWTQVTVRAKMLLLLLLNYYRMALLVTTSHSLSH